MLEFIFSNMGYMATQISMTFLEDMNFNATVVVSSSFFRFRAPIFLLVIDQSHQIWNFLNTVMIICLDTYYNFFYSMLGKSSH